MQRQFRNLVLRAQRFSSTPRSFSTSTLAEAPAEAKYANHERAFNKETTKITYNIPPSILGKANKGLHKQINHPVNIIKNHIINYFNNNYKDPNTNEPLFQVFDSLQPKVTVKQNFDDLLFPSNHPGRSPVDTFYFDQDHVLRTHTSAHQSELLNKGNANFLAVGDCFRRDEIDTSHYPVFHQMEGVRVFSKNQAARNDAGVEFAVTDLKKTLEGMITHLFGNVERRWIDAYFPFTNPSLEMEIFFNGKWLEVFGCGVIENKILDNSKVFQDQVGWAFGLGLERLAMSLFDIPDIRYFWSEDPRFLQQFKNQSLTTKFKPFSKYPPCPKDISFWLPEDASRFHENDFFELVRELAGDLVENVSLVDKFTHPKTKLESRCYRITYRSHSRSLTNEEIDAIQVQVRQDTEKKLAVKLR